MLNILNIHLIIKKYYGLAELVNFEKCGDQHREKFLSGQNTPLNPITLVWHLKIDHCTIWIYEKMTVLVIILD